MTRRLFASLPTFAALAVFTCLLLPGARPPGSNKGPNGVPSEWQWRQRAYPHGAINPAGYRLMLDQAAAKELEARLARARGEKSAALDTPWIQAGPTNIGGRVTDLAIHPTNPDICYAGLASGGVLKTTDGGLSWTPILQDLDVITIGDLALDPQDPEVLYVGTGEANAASLSFFGTGLYRSPDGGQTWEHLGLEESVYIARVLVHPADSQRLYVAATGRLFGTDQNRGVYRSLDGGRTWDRAFALTDSTACTDLAMRPDDPDVIFAAMWERSRGLTYRRSGGPSSGLWRSDDGGDTWSEVTGGLPTGSNVGRIGVTICAGQPDRMYAIYADANAEFLHVYRSNDGGLTWSATSDGNLGGMYSNFGWYFGQVRVDPANPDHVFALGVPAYRTTNGGLSWSEAGGNMHVDHHALEFCTSLPGRLYAGNDGGLYRSGDAGATWTQLADQPANQFYAVEIDPANPTRLYGGTQDNGTLRTPDGGLDTWERIFGGDGFTVIVDHTDSDVIYVEYQYGNLYKSTNGGAWFSWVMDGIDSGDRMNWHTPVIMDPVDPNVLYYGSQRVYKTTDGAESWSPISGDLTNGDQGAGFGTITTLAVAPSSPAQLYAGTDDGRVWAYRPFSGQWVDISAGLPVRWVTDIRVHPTQPATVYVTFSGLRWQEPISHVYRTTDGGSTWVDVSGDLPEAPVQSLLIDPADPSSLVVANDVGVYWSPNGGQSWQVLGLGLPRVPVFDLDLHPATRLIAAGTYGRSIFTITMPDPVTAVEPVPGALAAGVTAAPNPFNPLTILRFELSASERVSLEILDVRGRRVAHPLDADLPAGVHEARWEGRDESGREVPSGVYLARLTAGRVESTVKLTLAR
ncbi:MAG: FlgD immunoglobulin-like domain containing protein [Candidatus Krumholzibacteriia bacterium]